MSARVFNAVILSGVLSLSVGAYLLAGLGVALCVYGGLSIALTVYVTHMLTRADKA